MTQTATKVQGPVIVEAKVYELPEPGLHTARIVDVQDLGLVKNEVYGDKEKIAILYLITDEKCKDGSDMVVKETMNKNFEGQKARLGIRLRGLGVTTNNVKSIDLTELVNMEVNVGIVHNISNGKTYANVDSAARPRRSRNLQAVAEEI